MRSSAYSHQRELRNAAQQLPLVQLVPPGDSSIQSVPSFLGEVTGHLQYGNLIWLPDNITVNGSAWSYYQQASYPWMMFQSGQDAFPTTTSAATIPLIKAAITAGQIPPMIVLYSYTYDENVLPAPGLQAWGCNTVDGGFPLETMLTDDLLRWIPQHTRARDTVGQRALCGFSKGGFETLHMRAKFGISKFACYVTMGAPRLDADFNTLAATYAFFSAGEQAAIFGSNTAVCQKQSPFASISGAGLFNVLGGNAGGLGSAPLYMIKSTGDTTTFNSMTNGITQLTNNGIAFDTVDLVTPTHNVGQYFTSWQALSGGQNLSWIASQFF